MALTPETPAAEVTRLMDALLERQKRVGFVGETPVIQALTAVCKHMRDVDARISAMELVLGQMIADNEDREPL